MIENDLHELFMKLNKLRASMLFSELKELGVTGPQMFLLKELRDGPKTIGDLAKASELSYSTISGIVDRMERKSIVERVRDLKDRRVIWIQLNPQWSGVCRFTEIEKNLFEDFHEVVTEEEIHLLRRVAEKLIGILETKLEGRKSHE